MEFIIIIGLILLNGVFSMSEIALVSSRKFRLENAAKRGNTNAQRALELADNPGNFLSTVQIGITLIGILLGIFSGDTITVYFREAINTVPFLQRYSQSIAVVIVVFIVTFFSIVLGELLPKRIGLMYPEGVSMLVARPMRFVSLAALPFVWLLTSTNDLLLKLFNIKPGAESRVTEEEIKSIIQESTEGGEIQEIEQDIVDRVFALGDRKASSLMTYRTDIVWINVNDNLSIIKNKIKSEIHSAYPVAKETIDDVLGIITIKDLMKEDMEANFSVTKYLRQPVYIHENAPAYQLLERFKKEKIHYAIVVDEFGATQGFITMDDLLDALIGDVTEYNQKDYTIVQRDENTWLIDAQYSYYEFLHYFDLDDYDNLKQPFQTIGGLIIEELKYIPNVGDAILFYDLKLEIVDMDKRRIDKILVTRMESADNANISK
jgi:putative hemolysin